MNRKLVPQRGWNVTNFWAFSNVHRLARFEIEHHFVLRAMIFEHTADVLEARHEKQKSEKDHDADHAVDRVGREQARKRRHFLADARRQIQRHELVEKDEHREIYENARGHHPGGDLRRLLVAFIQLRVGRKLERFHAQGHRLPQRSQAAQHRLAENRIFLRHPGDRALFGGHGRRPPCAPRRNSCAARAS